MDRDLIQRAYIFAKQKHKFQLRDDGQPYIYHPVRVARLIAIYKPSKNEDILVASALLHDTLEDTYTSYRELKENFGEKVASIVVELTTAGYMPVLEGKDVYLSHKMENMSSYALCIKLADRLDNIMSLSGTTKEKQQRVLKQTQNILDYLEKHITYTQSQQKLVDAIKQEMKKYNKNY